jgi:hypothetical protein
MRSPCSLLLSVLLALGIIMGSTQTAGADPVTPPPRSRWLVYGGVGTPVWRFVGGNHLGPWQQPTLLEIVGLAYTLYHPWFEIRVAGLFGQRLDQSGNSAGILTSLNLSVRPFNVGLAAVALNTPANGTNVGMAMTFGVGTAIGQSGVIFGFGGQIVTYPGLNWPVTLVLAPSVSFRSP